MTALVLWSLGWNTLGLAVAAWTLRAESRGRPCGGALPFLFVRSHRRRQ